MKKGWRVSGKAEHFDSGKWFDFVKSLHENKKYNPKGVLVIEIEEIRELA